MPPKAIPDRWIPYKACGEVIEGTRIICFKVPLKMSVQKNVREIEKIWDIPTVLADIPKLGAVIDLTNTARYYNPLDFLKANILHRKILMPGRVVPPESSVQEFMNTLDEFLAKNAESLVGVHCTHGLNRTGYMVCRYMRDRMGIPAEEAITKFESARGYKIERDIYRNSILGKPQDTSGDGKEPEVIPVKPRRDDVNYRSPLDDYWGSPSVDSRNRFGNRDSLYADSRNRFENRDNSNADRRNRFGNRPSSDGYSSNRYSNQRNINSDRSTNSSAFFKCYTDRYKSDRDFSARSKGDSRRTDRPPISWRNQGEGSRDTRRRTNNYFNRNEDEPRSNDRPRQYDNPRSNNDRRPEDSSIYERPRFDYRTRSGL